MAKSYKVSSGKPLAGLMICYTGDKSFTLQEMKKNDNNKWVKDERGAKHQFRRSDLPDTLSSKFVLKNGIPYHCRVSSDGEELLDIRPATGSFVGKFVGLATNNDGDIFTQEKDGKWGKYQSFVAEVEVTEEPFKGVRYPKYVIFTSWDKKAQECSPLFMDDGEGYLAYGDTKQLTELFEFSGLADVNIKYSDDLMEMLGRISAKLAKSDSIFRFSVEKGYPQDLLPEVDYLGDDEEDADDDDAEDDDDDEVEEKEEVKAPAPKAKKSKFDDED